MITCLAGISSCFSFICRHFWSICMMVVGVVFVVLFLILFGFGPPLVLGDLRSWFCGTCTVCQVCPSCEPHLNVSPKCECHENLNNCNCNCITHENLQKYHQQWNSQLLVNQHNIHAAQQNTNQFKRQLLFWIIGIAIFNVLLLFLIIILIVFTPTLLRRCSKWKLNSTVKRRQRFMQKHNLIKKPSTIVVDDDIQLSQLSASHVDQQQISYPTLITTREHQKQLTLPHPQAEQIFRKSNISPARPSIF